MIITISRESGKRLSEALQIPCYDNERQIDKNRAKRHEMAASIPWGEKEGYDLCINTSGREIKTLIPAPAAYCQAVSKD